MEFRIRMSLVSVHWPILEFSDLASIRRVGFCVAPSPAPRHNIQHFCVRELGTSSRAYLASALTGGIGLTRCVDD